MIRDRKKKVLKSLTQWLLIVVIGLSCLNSPTGVMAAGFVPDTIRVAMFLDLGSTYKSVVPAVTLESESPWNAGVIGSAGYQQMVSLPANNQVRFSLDSFRVKVLETTDWKMAMEVSQKLSSTVDKPILFSSSLGGLPVYQLYTGMYATEQAGTDAVNRVNQTVGANLNGQVPSLKGNNHLSVGNFTTIDQAIEQQNMMFNAGYDARVAVQYPLTGGIQYGVWVGEAINVSELTILQQDINLVIPGIQLSTVDSSIPALILRQDVGLNTTALKTVDHYQISGESTKVWIPNQNNTMKVMERSKRSYRGNLEISSYNGQLSLINELPLEQYLYSVVGGETPSSWPAAALKSQAVAARSYAIFQKNKFKVADVVDTTLSQVYNGISTEAPSITQAVDDTKGEILVKDGKVVETIFSSNSGGVTADSSEVWNSNNNTFSSVTSEGDLSAENSLQMWYYVLLNNGLTGYIRADNVKELTSTTLAGLTQLTVTATNTNVRPIPQIQSTVEPIGKLNPGDMAVILDKVTESNSYSWIRGPYTSAELLKTMQGRSLSELPTTIRTLEITKRGPSGRVIELMVNGQFLNVRYPDQFRSALNGLPSTLFDIVSTGSYTVLGSDGATVQATNSSTSVISSSGINSLNGNTTVIMNGDSKAIVVDASEKFKFIGQGNGHGLGLSQWGAKGMADAGNDYQDILKHYYQNVTIVKE
ncbi:SpoIID/LytB domain-containing protein [Paenibacillus crassostreae]|uniref:Sporulation protein n=1 Tax=Paenibacillus crassostreae TaxID=1763538 RepID=A0A167CH43_9BACL|nr:SpoIID/LytB domain-containing protein [Paenibacillus crassostreae]AOZ91887.1 sporulation protein [Paenibacillus crassostreae]OAB73189.1 sporulation protein [Paenibacillus crassostreae]